MKHTFLFLTILSCTLFGCSDDTLGGTLSAKIEGDQLVLTNSSFRDIYYFASDEGTLAVILWAPSVNDGTPKVDVGQTTQVPLTEITGYSVETETIVIYYWIAVESEGRVAAGEVKSLTLNL